MSGLLVPDIFLGLLSVSNYRIFYTINDFVVLVILQVTTERLRKVPTYVFSEQRMDPMGFVLPVLSWNYVVFDSLPWIGILWSLNINSIPGYYITRVTGGSRDVFQYFYQISCTIRNLFCLPVSYFLIELNIVSIFNFYQWTPTSVGKVIFSCYVTVYSKSKIWFLNNWFIHWCTS